MHLTPLEVSWPEFEAQGDAFELPVVILPARVVVGAVIQLDADASGLEPRTYVGACSRQSNLVDTLHRNRHKHHLEGGIWGSRLLWLSGLGAGLVLDFARGMHLGLEWGMEVGGFGVGFGLVLVLNLK